MNAPRPLRPSDEQLRDALTRRPDPQRMTEDLAFIVATVERTHQRRWLLARLTGAAPRLRSTALMFAVLAMLLALGVALTVFVGSRHRLPPPFGLAKPGLIAFDIGGQIFVADPDGRGRTQLTSGSDRASAPKWSPDGSRIAFVSQGADLSLALVVVDADGRNRVTVADQLAEDGDFVWSPDSHRIAFGARLVGSDSSHIYVTDADRAGAKPLGGPDVFGVEPSWSPDGKQIAFKRLDPTGGDPSGWAGNQSGARNTLWLIGADGSDPHQLTSTTGSDVALWNTTWAPDGKRLAFVANGLGDSLDVYVINADGTGERNISNSPENEGYPSWSPDGTRIASTRDNGGAIIVVDPDGSHAVSLADPLILGNTAVWSPDGTRLFVFAKNWLYGVDHNSAIVAFDSAGRAPPMTIPADGFNSASWQRLAP